MTNSIDKTDQEFGFVYIQEGGSSGELYLHSFNTQDDANAGAKSCADASYRTSPIIKVPMHFLNSEGFETLIQEILSASVALEYAE